MTAYIIYWLCAGILFYSFIGYGLMIAALAKAKKARVVSPAAELPAMTIIIPAYNEAALLQQKISNTLAQQYPQLQIFVVTDGSTDGSEQIASAFPHTRVFHRADRQGKAAAINEAMTHVHSPLAAITDANCFLSPGSLQLLAGHFADPLIGAMSGEKKVVEEGEGLYWKYESWLKTNDARAGTIVGAAGEILVFRTAIYEPLEPDTILDDFVLSLRICLKGYKVGYEPQALAIETGSLNTAEEAKRKFRIAAGGFQAMRRLKQLWQFWRHPMLSFQYISHRVTRWSLAPVCLFLFFVVNIILVVNGAGNWYRFTAILQCFFYGAAFVGWLGARVGKKWRFVYLPYYFVFMHWAVIKGWYRFQQKRQDALWEKSQRATG
ncbi:MAG TPA: glycosyltransferase family 2 protein [Flavihumibacter sp.]|mgnify:CR=1 FL=1|nr:glycosyltransferase family 2 protein [Flavihumibacter sp.]